MAVYERTYKRYEGSFTPIGSRFLVLPKYALKDVFKSRWMLLAFAANFLFPLFCIGAVYISHNDTFLALSTALDLKEVVQMSPEFMSLYMTVQGITTFSLSLFVGPGLISRDLANNGLALYFSRPFSRSEYVVGKLTVLAFLLSCVTWIPAFLLMLVEANFVGWSWVGQNLRLIAAVFAGSWLWILFLGFLALSVSAWVKWRPIAAFGMLLFFLAGAFFGSGMVNGLFRTDFGHLFNPTIVFRQIWRALLGIPSQGDFPLLGLLLVVGLVMGIFLFLLHRKIRAYEVVS